MFSPTAAGEHQECRDVFLDTEASPLRQLKVGVAKVEIPDTRGGRKGTDRFPCEPFHTLVLLNHAHELLIF